MFLYIEFFMKKFLVFLSAIFSILIWFSFAIPTTLDSSYSVNWDNTVSDSHYASDTNESATEEKIPTRTVIPAVPQTGPSISRVWIILATLAIFGGYIYIKKRADI